MSELHMGLIGLGALGVLGVLAYNAWVGYRHRQRAGSLLDPLEKDALFDMAPADFPGGAPEGIPECAPAAQDADTAEAAGVTEAAEAIEAAGTVDFGADDAAGAVETVDWGNRLDEGIPQTADAASTHRAERDALTSRDSAVAAFAASATRWLGGLPKPFAARAGGADSHDEEATARERIEPGLGEAAFPPDEAAWRAEADPAVDAAPLVAEFADSADSEESGEFSEFGEILESRPFDESERRALSAAAAASAQAFAQAAEPAMPAQESLDAPLSETGEPLHLLSPSVDYIATLEAAAGAPAAEWLGAQRALLARAEKPVHWAGFDEESGEWTLLAEAAEGTGGEAPRLFRHVRAGLQLADRRGALSDNDLLIFATAMDALARDWQAQGRAVMLDLPDPRPVPAAAAELDAFCASVDIQISLNVVAADEAFQGTKIRALAEAAGMAIDADGRFVRADDDGNTLYVLLNHDPSGFSAETMRSMSAHGLSFLLDVPTVARGERVFGQLVDLAKRFAQTLKGVMVDDNRRPLSEASLEPIRQEIAQFQARMAERNLPAGGRMARRLFS